MSPRENKKAGQLAVFSDEKDYGIFKLGHVFLVAMILTCAINVLSNILLISLFAASVLVLWGWVTGE